MRRAAKRDANHGEIVKVWESMGALVIDTAGLEKFVDAVVVFRGVVYLAEIKDGSKPPSARELTGAQVVLHARVLGHGSRVHVITNETEALAMIGAKVSA